MPCCSKSSKKRSLCSDQRLEGNNSILYIGIKNTVFNAYIPNAPNTLLGSVLPGIPNPRTQSYLQKGFVRILADKLPFLREYPYVSNHIYTWIHWTMSGENSMFSTICIPVVSVGLFGVWRGEHFSTLEGWTAIKIPSEKSLNLHSGWLFPDCVKKTPTQMVITNYR